MTKADKLSQVCEVYDETVTMTLIESVLLCNADESLFETDEGVREFLKDASKSLKPMLSKLGFEVHHSRGLIQVMLKSNITMARLFYHAIRAFVTKDEQSLQKVKEIASKEIKKEDVWDFLLKLDMATAHLVTGPLHVIDAITGWHLAPKLDHGHHGDPEKEGKQKNLVQRFREAIKDLKETSQKLSPMSLKQGVSIHVKGIIDVLKAHANKSGKKSILIDA